MEFKDVTQYCFYLDIQNRVLATNISKKIQDLRLRQEVFLTSVVTHVVRQRAVPPPPVAAAPPPCAPPRAARLRTRADAMLERVRPLHTQHQHLHHQPPSHYTVLTVPQAVDLLNEIYDRMYGLLNGREKPYFKIFTKHYIKVEILDKLCRPLYQEFDEWPEISTEPTIVVKPKYHKHKSEYKMTRKSRPRIKEREEKERKGGYCEICNTDYTNADEHQRSLHHMTFVRDQTNFLSLDTLIGAGADVNTFLDKAAPLNGERRSLRKMCNGDMDSSHTRSKRSNRSQSPDSSMTISSHSPKRVNGALDDDRKHNTRCSKRTSDYQTSEDRGYYKVVGVSTKLRSSGGFASKRNSPPACNGSSKPLVVKFRRVRRSELSVLSDEAEQFMFPRRASSTSSTSSEEEEKNEIKKSSPQPPLILERKRLARPLALKEESSEEDSWLENKRRKKRKTQTAVRRVRPTRSIPVVEPPPEEPPPVDQQPAEKEPSPLRIEPNEKCMKWEDGKLKYTPAVEQLEFAFESVPLSEPWFETFRRQDEDKPVTKTVPNYFALYSKSPKLPYEIGPLPPLKPNCCALSDYVKREEKPGPSRSYGTRGNKKQKIRKRTAAALVAMESHPRKSPREHASTLAILGSVGLLHRRKNVEDSKSTASEDTASETHSNAKVEPTKSETQEASERLQQFFSEVFDDAADYEVPDDVLQGEPAVVAATNVPDVTNLVSECETCEIIRDEIASSRISRRGHRFKKKNRTGWPNKKKNNKKGSRTESGDGIKDDNGCDTSSLERPDNVDDSTRDESMSEAEETIANDALVEDKSKTATLDDNSTKSDSDRTSLGESDDRKDESSPSSDDRPLRLDVKVLLRSEDKAKTAEKIKNNIDKREGRASQSSTSETEDKELTPLRANRKRGSAIQNVGEWLQPVVRVVRVARDQPVAVRRLRSAARVRRGR